MIQNYLAPTDKILAVSARRGILGAVGLYIRDRRFPRDPPRLTPHPAHTSLLGPLPLLQPPAARPPRLKDPPRLPPSTSGVGRSSRAANSRAIPEETPVQSVASNQSPARTSVAQSDGDHEAKCMDGALSSDDVTHVSWEGKRASLTRDFASDWESVHRPGIAPIRLNASTIFFYLLYFDTPPLVGVKRVPPCELFFAVL